MNIEFYRMKVTDSEITELAEYELSFGSKLKFTMASPTRYRSLWLKEQSD